MGMKTDLPPVVLTKSTGAVGICCCEACSSTIASLASLGSNNSSIVASSLEVELEGGEGGGSSHSIRAGLPGAT